MMYNKLKIGKIFQLTNPSTIQSTYSITFSEKGRSLVESIIDETLGRVGIKSDFKSSNYRETREISYILEEYTYIALYDNTYELKTIEITQSEVLL